jgi:hypothetical protein
VDLADLLTATASEYLDDRTDLVDGDPDQLWGDAFLVRMFNEAQRILARRSWVIIETGVAPAGQIVLATGKSLYALHPSVLRVFDATPSSQTLPIGRGEDVMLRDATLSTAPLYDWFGAYEIGEAAALAGNTNSTNGTVLAFASDAGSRTLRVSPAPLAAQSNIVVSLKIARMPITNLTLDDTEAEPEVPEEWHQSLVWYAAGRALTQPNVDGQQKQDGRNLLAEFDLAVKQARQERIRAEMGNNRWQFASTTAVLR